MIKSMKARLFLILVLTTSVVWLSAVAWIFFSTRAQVERVLDDRLMEAANMVSSLLVAQDFGPARAANLIAKQLQRPSTYERQLSCQIWSFEGNLLSKSEAAPTGELTTHRTGFSDTVIDGETWRVYAVENKDVGIRVLVGDTRRIRSGLVGDIIKGLLLPAFIIMPLLAALIWFSVRSGLAPLNRIATALGTRSASDFRPLQNDQSTSEMTPVIAALNGLFRRVADARERERNFTTFAAHELRTPLAGLKTQAQVAMASNDPDTRERALSQIVHGVNRTGRLVRQLLDLASVDAHESDKKSGSVNPGEALALLRGEFLAHSGRNTQIVISKALCDIDLPVDPDLFTLAARNLLENAILHSPIAGTITCDLLATKDAMSVAIDDSGPGIPTDEISRVKERFFRGRNKTAIGSGLGLTIADVALDHAGATLELHNRAQGGLSARIVVAAGKISSGPSSD
jgi:two-component system, OmpR family, sensor histidine kinase QseC